MTPIPSTMSMDVNDQEVKVTKIGDQDYICLTDMAKSFGADRVVENWLRNKNTVEFLGVWERFNNTDFNSLEFEGIKNTAGLNRFTISVKEWADRTNAKGIVAKTGRYGGTYAHKDIAFEFGTWLSPEFKLLVISEYQRLKPSELEQVEWDSRRFLTSANYRLHTDAIKEHIIPMLGTGAIQQYVYTSEADMLNRLVFGQTAAEWKKQNPRLSKGQRNQRDYASTEQLIIMANLESLNSHLISEQKTQSERLSTLAKEARRQYDAIITKESTAKKFTDNSKKGINA
ncbi:MAG: KilA-N domain-containing protein [Candidatus Saccharimonas sp.]